MNTSRQPHHPILVIDDEEAILLSVDTILQFAGMNNVITCSDSRQALAIMKKCPPSVVLLDLNMPHLGGEALMEQFAVHFPQVPVIIITGQIDTDTAVQCMKAGAFDYIVKPVKESRLITAITKSLRFGELYEENRALRQHLIDNGLKHPQAFEAIVTHSPKMLSLFAYIESIAATAQPVLIRGETGVGKELFARAIHHLSGRSGAFVAINVAGLDDNVFSDTLFGHVKGAFTGADSNRSGLIERAAGGTLFLDEIGDLNAGSQVKLLRLLQENEYMPLGQDQTLQSSARIITSTHADLWAMQQSNTFRKDLHYRLRTHRLLVPPLRERKEDLGLLTEHFLERAAEALDKSKPTITAELHPLLESYHFPGNVREMQAMIFDSLAQHKSGVLSLSVFRSHIARARLAEASTQTGEAEDGVPLLFADPLPTIKQATRMLIGEAMERAGNNQSIAATMLGISQQALSKRLKTLAEST